MHREYFFISFAAVAVLLLSSLAAFAQSGVLSGQVTLRRADGTTTPVAGAAIDVFRTDLRGKYETKTDKSGNFVFARLPFVGTYIISVSAPNAQPKALGGAKAGREIEYEVALDPGDGRRLTLEEARTMASGGGSGGGESAEARAMREELLRKNAEIAARNKKIEESNAIVSRTFNAGNDAFTARNYDEALKQYEEGLAADPEQPALLTNKAQALKARGVQRYNAAIVSTDAAKTSAVETAKADFKAAADTTEKALELIKAQTAPADPAELAKYNANKLATLITLAETMRIIVTKVDQSQVEAGKRAFEEYIAAETDPARKAKAHKDLAQMLFDAFAGEEVEDPTVFEVLSKHLCPADSTANYVVGVNGPVNTGIKIKSGDRITIRASGLVNFGILAGQGGPKGIQFNPDYNKFADSRHGCLLVRKNSGKFHNWFYVGKGRVMIPEEEGALEFDVNDNDPGNNTGQFKIEISICKAP